MKDIKIHELESVIKTTLSVIDNMNVRPETQILAKNFLHKIFEKLEEISQ